MTLQAPRQLIIWGFLIFPFYLFGQVEQSLDISDFNSPQNWLYQIGNIRHTSPDSAIALYHTSYEYYLGKKDTLAAVNTLVDMAVTFGHTAQYQSAYDKLWDALSLADLAENDLAKIIVYINLGRYYSFYKREETAFKYFHLALDKCKKMVAENQVDSSELQTCYYALSSTYRDLEDPINAKIYLDSCYLYFDSLANGTADYHFLQFESAYIQRSEGNYQKSLATLFAIQPWFEENSPGFQVLLFTHLGDVYSKMKNKAKAEEFYQKALTISEKHKSHLDFIPTIYERLSKLYAEKGVYKAAFKNLQKVKELDAQFFDSRSKNNASLLEIKDEFREGKEKQQKLLQQQRLAQLEQEERVSFLQNILLLVTIFFLVFAGILYFNYVRNKHKSEKVLIRKKRELEIQQANELLELKNKELAASSLKLIEKDEILSTLKTKLSEGKGDIKEAELKKIVRSISHSNSQNWEEFELRFLSVNKGFFDKLNQKYPKLTRGELKLCSLVKLNLTSKEMAKLMGISLESVHTNRYRLRKKLNLNRDTSLNEFLATL